MRHSNEVYVFVVRHCCFLYVVVPVSLEENLDFLKEICRFM